MVPLAVMREKEADRQFVGAIGKVPGVSRIRECIQCGTCSGSCPTAHLMQYGPREIIGMVRAGMKDKILKSNTIWMCVSCYSCTARCPQEIPVTNVMYALKQLANREHRFPRDKKPTVFPKAFLDIVQKYGRSHETELMTKFCFQTDPMSLLKKSGLGYSLLTHGRLSIAPHKMKNQAQLDMIIGLSLKKEV